MRGVSRWKQTASCQHPRRYRYSGRADNFAKSGTLHPGESPFVLRDMDAYLYIKVGIWILDILSLYAGFHVEVIHASPARTLVNLEIRTSNAGHHQQAWPWSAISRDSCTRHFPPCGMKRRIPRVHVLSKSLTLAFSFPLRWEYHTC